MLGKYVSSLLFVVKGVVKLLNRLGLGLEKLVALGPT